MYNKLSILPTESLYPACLALDDYQDIDDKDLFTPKKEGTKIKLGKPKDYISTKEYLDCDSKFMPELAKTETKPGVTIETLYASYLNTSYNRNDVDYNVAIKNEICKALQIKYKKDNKNFEDFETQFYIFCVILRGDIIKNWGMLAFAKKMKILLVKPDDMPKNIDEKSTEYLGYYSSLCEVYQRPIICLCPERIKTAATNIAEKVLFAKVLIHELAHAMMDPTNKLDDNGNLIKNGAPQIMSEADSIMEESLANMITLEYFEAAKSIIGKDDFEQVKSFMDNQPNAYKFGITQYEQHLTDWKAWRDNKSTMKFWIEWSGKVQPHIEELKKLKIV